MDVGLFDFELPPAQIAQQPAPEREAARLLVLERASGRIAAHAAVRDLPRFLSPRDVLVLNNTKVFPARLLGRRDPSGGAVECLLVRRLDEDCWEALMHPGQKLHPGAKVVFGGGGHVLHAEVVAQHFYGRRTVRLWTEGGENVDTVVDAIGHVPLPPYIHRDDSEADRERYQTVYARERGSVAAPTAGLHLTPGLLDAMAARGIERAEVTLHVGYGTFQPVRAERVEDHHVHPEWFDIGGASARAINDALGEGRRVVAVGTTTTRALESAALESVASESAGAHARERGTGSAAAGDSDSVVRAESWGAGAAGGAGAGAGAPRGRVQAGARDTELFIYPGFEFRVCGGLLTNFHLPRSSLLMLVCAFAGRDAVLSAYREAVSRGYRFYSYGDAMLIV